MKTSKPDSRIERLLPDPVSHLFSFGVFPREKTRNQEKALQESATFKVSAIRILILWIFSWISLRRLRTCTFSETFFQWERFSFSTA